MTHTSTLTTTERQELTQRYHSGESATALCLQAGVPRSTFYSWLKPRKTTSDDSNQAVTVAEHIKVKNRVSRLEKIIEVLKKVSCTASSPLKEKLTELEKLHGQYSIHLICEALDVPRGTFYNHIFRNKRENNNHQARRDWLCEQIKQVYDESNQIYGSRKIKAVLSERGIATSDRMVAELMDEMNLRSIRNDAKKIHKRINSNKKKDELQMNFSVKAPNTVWVSDTTRFQLDGRTHYICAILDLYSRKVVAYKVSQKHSTQLISSTFKLAYADRQPSDGLIFHSDQGTQYTAYSFQNLLKTCNVTQSFSPPGKPRHNAVMESFFSTLKREELYRMNYHSVQEFKGRLEWYINFYNMERPHATLGQKPPNAYEQIHYDRLDGKSIWTPRPQT